jgi:hypothetical protein
LAVDDLVVRTPTLPLSENELELAKSWHLEEGVCEYYSSFGERVGAGNSWHLEEGVYEYYFSFGET